MRGSPGLAGSPPPQDVLLGAADCTGTRPGERGCGPGAGGRARASEARLEGAGPGGAAGVGIGHLRASGEDERC